MNQGLANPVMHSMDGILDSLNGRTEQGEAILAKVVADNPNLTALLIARGRVRLRRGLFDLAIEDFDRAYRQDPKFVDAINFRAKANEKAGRTDMAAKDRAKACRLGWMPDCVKKRRPS
jgi:Flp pilus assembly protein TadD